MGRDKNFIRFRAGFFGVNGASTGKNKGGIGGRKCLSYQRNICIAHHPGTGKGMTARKECLMLFESKAVGGIGDKGAIRLRRIGRIEVDEISWLNRAKRVGEGLYAKDHALDQTGYGSNVFIHDSDVNIVSVGDIESMGSFTVHSTETGFV